MARKFALTKLTKLTKLAKLAKLARAPPPFLKGAKHHGQQHQHGLGDFRSRPKSASIHNECALQSLGRPICPVLRPGCPHPARALRCNISLIQPQGTRMSISTEQMAELLAGIARSQQAIIDAIESESGGWRNTHFLPKITTASNMRLAVPRIMDVPSRVLLRSQGRVPMDVAQIVRMLEEAMHGAPAAAPAAPAAAAPAAAPAAAAAGAVAATAAVAGAPGGESSPTGSDDLGSFFDS